MEMRVNEIQFVKELYPRLKENTGIIEQYRAAIDLLPPITLARGAVLVDGYHRWQAHRREGLWCKWKTVHHTWWQGSNVSPAGSAFGLVPVRGRG